MSDEQDTGASSDPGSDGGGSAGSTPNGAADGGSRWLLWLLVVLAVFVGGGVFYHLSSENSDRWFLEVRKGEVVVRKGIWFPTGAADYDGGAAYEPVPLPEGMDPPGREHDSLQSVDNAIYRLLIASASAAIDSGDANRIESAKGLLGRARLLAGITQDQADEVLRYRGDIAMAEGHLAIKEVKALLERAKGRVAAGVAKGTRLYRDPEGWVRWIDAKLAEFTSLDDAREPPASLCPPCPDCPEPPPCPGADPGGDPILPADQADPTDAAAPTDPTAPSEPFAPAPPAPDGAKPAPAPPGDSGLAFPLFPEAGAPAKPAPPADKAEGEGEGELKL